MRAEMPFIAAGAVTIAGGVYREKAWPSEGARAILGTLTIVVVASALNDTAVAPLVRAVGMLVLLVAVIATVRSVKGIK